MIRWTTTLLAAAALALGGVPTPAPQLELAASTSFTVTATLRPREIILGQKARLSGTVSPVRTGTQVRIQRKTPSGWITIAKKYMNDEGAYRHTVSPTKVGSYLYRARMPRVGSVLAANSPQRRLYVIADPTVAFTIPQGTGVGSWNSSGNPVKAKVGNTLRLVNGDSVAHQLHTNGTPFPHPGTPLAPGETAEYVLQQTFTGSLYCHIHGSNSEFWLTVSPAS